MGGVLVVCHAECVKFFGKRSGNADADQWTLAQGVVDGHPTLLRTKHTKRDRARPVRITIKIGLSQPDPDGLPGPEEMDFLAEVEDILFNELVEHGAELVLVVTANHAREFIAYCATHDCLDAWGPSVISRWGEGRPGTGIEAAAKPNWDTYEAFAVR